MLLSFRTANVLSIRDEQTLSFVATDLNDGSALPTRIHSVTSPVSSVPSGKISSCAAEKTGCVSTAVIGVPRCVLAESIVVASFAVRTLSGAGSEPLGARSVAAARPKLTGSTTSTSYTMPLARNSGW